MSLNTDLSSSTSLRALLDSPNLEFLMEAHSGLSAKIVEEAGFQGIWASGLSISAELGLRDCNEASWTQALEIVEYMCDATTLPILFDGDSGYGDFNNVRRLVRKLEQRGVAGVCIEDKVFPKRNSFLDCHQKLSDAIEFTGKIRAAKDTQSSADFCVIARLEGFIAGASLAEVQRRAHLYANAGADALLVHSKQSKPDEILAFTSEWDQPTPLIIVPTTYSNTPNQVFEDAGISIAIWANHTLRSSIKAMQDTCRQVFEDRTVANLGDKIVPIKEVFRLQCVDELSEAEKQYLPQPEHTNIGCAGVSRRAHQKFIP